MNLLKNFQSQLQYTWGRNDTVGTSIEEVYSASNTVDWLTTLNPPSTLTVSSTSGNDTSTGTGARTVRLIGYNSDGNLITEVITLNGTNTVNTTLQYRVVVAAEVLTAGTSKANEGTINVVKSTTTLLQITPGINEGMNGLLVIPAGYTGKIVYVEAISRSQAATVYVATEPLSGSGPLSYLGTPLECGANSPKIVSQAIFSSQVLSEKTLVRLRAIGAAASASVVASMQIQLTPIRR